MTSRESALTTLLTSGRYALVGAGQLGEMSLAMWPEDVPRPELVLDSVRKGALGGIPIADLPTHRHQPGLTYVLAAFKMPPAAIRAIFDGVGQRDIVTVYDFLEQFTPATFSNGWRNLDPTADTLARLAALPGLYADDLSRDICAAVTAWRYRRELIDGFPVGREEDKYNLALLGCAGRHYDLIYDGGPYDLGLLDSLAKSGISWDEVIAFEPDPAHRAVCDATAKRWTAEGGAPVTIDTRALSNRTGRERFLASGLFSSRLIEDSALDRADLIEVSTCRLDDAHRDRFGAAGERKRILLKLHVEGAELAVLEGAADLLRDHKVDVLVNLSHDEPSWRDLPAYLAGFGCFDLILRCHALFGEGLTLFARNRA